MSNRTMKVVGALQGKSRRLLKHSSVLALTLGLSASGVASPTVKRGPVSWWNKSSSNRSQASLVSDR